MDETLSNKTINKYKKDLTAIERHILKVESELKDLEKTIKDKQSHLHELKKKSALNRLRDLQKYRNLSQPFESEDSVLLEMQELMDFLKEDPSIKAYLEKTLYNKKCV